MESGSSGKLMPKITLVAVWRSDFFPLDGGKPVLSMVEGTKMGVLFENQKSPFLYPSHPGEGNQLDN